MRRNIEQAEEEHDNNAAGRRDGTITGQVWQPDEFEPLDGMPSKRYSLNYGEPGDPKKTIADDLSALAMAQPLPPPISNDENRLYGSMVIKDQL